MPWSYSILFLLWWVFSSQPYIFQDFYNERIMVFTKSHFYFYVMKYNYWFTYVKLSFHHLDEADSSWWMTILMFSYFFLLANILLGIFMFIFIGDFGWYICGFFFATFGWLSIFGISIMLDFFKKNLEISFFYYVT